MTKYKITVAQLNSQEFIVDANSSDEAIESVKSEIGMLEISGDVEIFEQ